MQIIKERDEDDCDGSFGPSSSGPDQETRPVGQLKREDSVTDEGIAIAVLTALAVVLFLIGKLYRNDLREGPRAGSPGAFYGGYSLLAFL